MQEVKIEKCGYANCIFPVNKPHDSRFCIFHAPKKHKGIPVEEFNQIIFNEKIAKNDFNFRGYIFPDEINFPKVKITKLKDANFNRVKFSGDVNFREVEFSGNTLFRETQFLKDADFRGTRFSGYTEFMKTQFSWNVYFIGAQFSVVALFNDTKFLDVANFGLAQFLGDVYFTRNEFSGSAYFGGTKFSKDVFFVNNVIQKKMNFENISFLKDSNFYFRNPLIVPNKESEILINFLGINFLPFRTYFENIRLIDAFSKQVKPELTMCFLFRYCQLNDVYFTGSDMSFFSFYKSNFDQARFISCDWREGKDSVLKLPYKRRNILFEDFLFSNIAPNKKEESQFSEKYHIDDLELKEIGSLYRRMKAALDRTKDYQESGWFYFNEFETKRRELKFGPKKLIYYLYKVFSGYGEKPFWSFIWFWIFVVIFSFIHLLSGLNTSDGQINYDISLKWEAIRNIFSGEFLGNWLNSFVFTFYRLIPVNYMPYTDSTITPVGLQGLILALLNTLILILMITFIGIGLKRQFRRF